MPNRGQVFSSIDSFCCTSLIILFVVPRGSLFWWGSVALPEITRVIESAAFSRDPNYHGALCGFSFYISDTLHAVHSRVTERTKSMPSLSVGLLFWSAHYPYFIHRFSLHFTPEIGPLVLEGDFGRSVHRANI